MVPARDLKPGQCEQQKAVFFTVKVEDEDMASWQPGIPLGAAKFDMLRPVAKGHLHQTDHRPSSILVDAGHGRVMRRENELQNASQRFPHVPADQMTCPDEPPASSLKSYMSFLAMVAKSSI